MVARPPLGELSADLATLARDEWQSRTRYGKVLYPFWLFDKLFEWFSLLVFISFILFASLVVGFLTWEPDIDAPSTPAVHKEGSNDD